MAEIDRLEIVVTADTESAVKKLKTLKTALDSLGKANGSTDKISKAMNSVKTQTEGLEKALSGVSKEMSKVVDTKKVFDSQPVELYKKSLEQASNFAGTLVNNFEPLKDFRLHSNIGEMFRKTFDPSINQGVKSIQSFAGSIGSILNPVLSKCGSLLGKVGLVGAKAFGSALTAPVRKFVSNIGSAIKKLSKLKSSIARVVLYRTLRAMLKAVTDGFDEGLKAVYKFDKGVGGSFSQTMDELASQLSMVKGAVGAMAMPLIEALAPAIMTVTNAVIQLVNAFNQLFSIIGGKSSWTKVTSAVKEYDDSVSGASKSTKDLTAGIDELNILNDSAGGGGSNSGADYAFSTEELASWAKDLKALFDTGQFFEFGKGLANLLNEAIANWDAKAWGRKLGEKIQSGIEISYGFWTGLNTESLGTKIGQFINEAMNAIDTEMAGKAFGEKWNRIVDLIYGFVTEFEWGTFATKLTDWIRGAFVAFNPQKLADTLNETINGIFTLLSTFVATFPSTEIVKSIFKFFNGIKWGDIGKNVGTLARELIVKAIRTLNEIIKNFDIVDMVMAVGSFIKNVLEAIDIPTIVAELAVISLNIVDKLVDILGNVVPAFLSTGNPTQFKEKLESYRADTESWTSGMGEMLRSWADGIEQRSTERLEGLRKNFDETGSEITGDANSYADIFNGIVAEGCDNVKGTVSNAVYYTYDEVSGGLVQIESALSTSAENAKTSAVELGNAVAQPWASFQSLGDKAEETEKRTNQSFENVQKATSTSWSQIKQTTEKDWDTIQKKVESTWKQLEEKATERFTNIKNTITDKWKEILDDTTEKWGIVGTIPTLIKDGLAIAEAGFVSLKDAIDLNLNLAYESIDDFVTKSIERFNDLIDKLQEYNSEKASGTNDISISAKTFATGGFPQTGSLFIAREAGAEMVGSFGGRTAVANNDQIVEGITAGVYSAVVSAMSQYGSSNGNVNVYLDGKKIESSVRNTKQRRGATIANGGIFNYA